MLDRYWIQVAGDNVGAVVQQYFDCCETDTGCSTCLISSVIGQNEGIIPVTMAIWSFSARKSWSLIVMAAIPISLYLLLVLYISLYQLQFWFPTVSTNDYTPGQCTPLSNPVLVTQDVLLTSLRMILPRLQITGIKRE